MADEDIIPSPTPSPPRNGKLQMRFPGKTVIVEGNIGCGKTTFLNCFKKYDNVEVLPEPVAKWLDFKGYNALDLMYKDVQRWSGAFQCLVTLSMLDHHALVKKPHSLKIMERSVYSARYCFLENLRQSGLIPPLDHAVLTEWHSWLDHHECIGVDLIVYLRASPEVCAKRINQRNRAEEAAVPLDYLKALHRLHDDWLLHRVIGKLPAPVVVLDADQDLVSLKEEIERLSQDLLLGIED